MANNGVCVCVRVMLYVGFEQGMVVGRSSDHSSQRHAGTAALSATTAAAPDTDTERP